MVCLIAEFTAHVEMDTQKAFCAPRYRLSLPAIYIVSAILLRFVLMTHTRWMIRF